MTATTINQGIRYPINTDAPCDGDLHYGWMAEDIDSKLSSHEDTLDFLLQPPQLIVAQGAPLLYFVEASANQFILEFDTVISEIGDFGVFDISQSRFRVPRAGIYEMGLYASWPQQPAEIPTDEHYDFQLYQGTDLFLEANGNAEPRVWETVAARTFVTGDSMSINGLVRVPTTDTFYWWVHENTEPFTSFELTYLRAYAFWVADL